MWDASGGAAASMQNRIAVASRSFGSLCSLVRSGAIPLPHALLIFDSKIDGALTPGRWLYVLADGAQCRLDTLLSDWSCALLGGAPWRNSAVSRWELGWTLTGFARAILDMARRRAKLWSLPEDDFYRVAF
eukprot:10048599-Karenia_brevis.AAC.1